MSGRDVIGSVEAVLQEFRRLWGELEKSVARARGLEKEIGELLQKANLLRPGPLRSFIAEVVSGIPEVDDTAARHRYFRWYRLWHEKEVIHSPLSALRAFARRGEDLRRLDEVAQRLRVPDFPHIFPKPLDKEAEFLYGTTLERVRIREVRLLLLGGPTILVRFERGGTEEWEDIEKVWLLLLQVHGEVKELIGEAIGRLEQYCQELERLRAQVVSEHPKEILMHDL
jgi:hypothetical protein